jgi:hypothetical protein
MLGFYTFGITLVIFADGCYTLVTCSANDAFVLFQAGCSFSSLGKEIIVLAHVSERGQQDTMCLLALHTQQGIV